MSDSSAVLPAPIRNKKVCPLCGRLIREDQDRAEFEDYPDLLYHGDCILIVGAEAAREISRLWTLSVEHLHAEWTRVHTTSIPRRKVMQ